MRKPLVVVAGDVHFTLNTIEEASTVVREGLATSRSLGVPFLLNGDTLDTKAIIRGEIANRLISLLEKCQPGEVLINTGNHDLINQRAKESSLNFLNPYAEVVGSTATVRGLNIVPYHDTAEDFYQEIKKFPRGSQVFVHQGVIGGYQGDYVSDPSAVDPKKVTDWTIWASHYHRHFQIGTWTSIGSSYTTSYGEATDGDKGYLIVYTDGSFERKILKLRKHVKIEMTLDEVKNYKKSYQEEHPLWSVGYEDLLWLRISGFKSELSTLNKHTVASYLGFLKDFPFKLNLVSLDPKQTDPTVKKDLSGEQLLDIIIDEQNDTDAEKNYLKQLWRQLI